MNQPARGISAAEMARRAKAGETREAVESLTGATPLATSKDRRQAEMFGAEVLYTERRPPELQSDLFMA